MAKIVIELPGEPHGKERPRLGRHGKVYTPNKTATYERSLAWAAKLAMKGQRPLEGPLKVTVTAFMKRPVGKPDADNILKCVDALNRIVWRDDSQIVDARILKLPWEIPSLWIEVEQLFDKPTNQVLEKKEPVGV